MTGRRAAREDADLAHRAAYEPDYHLNDQIHLIYAQTPVFGRRSPSGRQLPNYGVVLYDVDAEIVFGPIFNDHIEAALFLRWCYANEIDPRRRTPGDLGDILSTWWNAVARYWPAIPGTTLTTPGAPS